MEIQIIVLKYNTEPIETEDNDENIWTSIE